MSTTEDGALQEIPEEDCYRLLAGQQVGRLGVNAENHPLIFPVNFVMDGTSVVIRTDAGTKLAAAAGAPVSFEVDEIDLVHRRGWSVLILGHAQEVTGEERAAIVARTEASGIGPWAPGERGHWLRLVADSVTGRRVVPGHLPPAVDPRAYL